MKQIWLWHILQERSTLRCQQRVQYLHLRSWHVRQLHGTTETLILLGIIVLEPDLQLYGLCEVPLLVLGLLQDACSSQ